MKNLEGKCKEDFEKWYGEWYLTWLNVNKESFSIEQKVKMFSTHLPFSMQSGVILEWLDSVGIYLTIEAHSPTRYYFNIWGNDKIFDGYIVDNDSATRQEALKEAIKKANEIYNK